MAQVLRALRRVLALPLAVLLVGSLVYLGLDDAQADHTPANKVSAAASDVEVFTPDDTDVTLLSIEMRTASPTDLILGVTAECSITTNVTTVGNEDQSAEGTVTLTVAIDGVEVPVTSGAEGDVVFCNRMYRRATSNFDDANATIETFFDTRNANAFNWVALDVGAGVHTIEVLADLEAIATQAAFARAAVGNRTLVVQPTMMANDAGV
jgi:hypothetical protein